jgi:small subunit ribosomal protein S18
MAFARQKGAKRWREQDSCRFCREKIREIDYKDIQSLQKLLSGRGKIFSRKRSGNCAFHQRSAQRAIKRSRFIGLLPFQG